MKRKRKRARKKGNGTMWYAILFLVLAGLAEVLVAYWYISVPIICFVLFLYLKKKYRWSIEKIRMSIIASKLKRFEKKYYDSEEFWNTRRSVDKHIRERNDLNRHILELKKSSLWENRTDFGKSDYYDNSYYGYARPEYSKNSQRENVYNCSRTVCDNARMQPFKYICKYFDIEPSEEVLEKFERLLNNFEAAKEGINLSTQEKCRILRSIDNDVPQIIRRYGYNKFKEKLGFRDVGLEKIQFPKYVFQYVSPGGNASTRCDVVMDIENLNRFINYLSEKIKFRKSAAGQRALMTSSLRKKILKRDDYTCQKCGNSTRNEPNLLLEIDHIVPISKGGMTTEDNLQVLCWRCNRSKGSKII